MTTWTTRVRPEITRRYGVEEIHNVWFTPNGWPGKGTTISLGIPECELQVVMLSPDGTPIAYVNRPQHNKSVKGWLRRACEMATAEKANIFLSCDTAAQADRAAKLAARWLPNHRRKPLERMYDVASRTDAGLN